MAWSPKQRATTTWTPKAINPAIFVPKLRQGAPYPEQYLEISSGITLDIGSGYELIISPYDPGQPYSAKPRQPL